MASLSVRGRYAFCEQVVRLGSLAADATAAAAADIRGMGVDAGAVDEIGVDEARRILDGVGVLASSYMGLGYILRPDGSTAPLAEVARRLEVAAALGAPGAGILTGKPSVITQPDADELCRDWLARAAPLAASAGVRIMLEAVHPIMPGQSFVHTLRHAMALTTGIPSTGVALDLGHVWWEHGLEYLISEHVEEIATVQVTNVDRGMLDRFCYQRAPVASSGAVPVAALVAVLEGAGYRGWYEDETIVRIPRDGRILLVRESREWLESL